MSSNYNGVFTINDAGAVKYFLEILSKKSSLTLNALSGHWNQASTEVKNVIKSTKPEHFEEFLKRNSFYFEIIGNEVSKRNLSVHQLLIKVNVEQYEANAIAYFLQKLAAKGKQTFPQLVSILNHDGTPETIGCVGSKKLSDVENFISTYSSIFLVENGFVTSCFERNMYEKISVVGISENCEDSNADDVLLPIKKESVVKSTNEVPVLSKKPAALKSNSISTSSDSQGIFEKLFGKEFLNSLTDLLKLLNVKGFDEIEMLWFDINRKPFVKLNKFASKHTLDILELEELPVNTSSSVRNVINKLVPVSSTAFGLENSLHTFRVNMRGSVPVGITMFHQVHDSIVKDFKESVIHNLRIIYYNRVETSANKIYSHIRRICANMSKYHHVVAVDFNGKITGYGCCSLPALYRTRCISAASSRSVTDALHEAYALNPDWIVTNCLDVMNEEVLELLKTFGKQGVRVVFPLDRSYEDVVNSVY